MSDGEWKADPISLTAPPGAGEDQDRFVVGEELPQELIDYYALNGQQAIGGIVMYHPPDEYTWLILALSSSPNFEPTIAMGVRNASGIIDLMQIRSSAGLPIGRITFGEFLDALTQIFITSTQQVELFGTMIVHPIGAGGNPGIVSFSSGSELNIADSAVGRIGVTAQIHGGLSGTHSAGPSAAGSFTSAVSFGVTLPSSPRVFINLASAAGPTANWHGRAFNITTTGFTLFGFGPAATFSTGWQWVAIIQ